MVEYPFTVSALHMPAVGGGSLRGRAGCGDRRDGFTIRYRVAPVAHAEPATIALDAIDHPEATFRLVSSTARVRIVAAQSDMGACAVDLPAAPSGAIRVRYAGGRDRLDVVTVEYEVVNAERRETLRVPVEVRDAASASAR